VETVGVLGTGTIGAGIVQVASATGRPDKVCGTHFIPPPPLREAVEVPRGLLTSDETVERVKDSSSPSASRPSWSAKTSLVS
jgi:3-hydroxyacyl-CoA dehydrogenase